MIRRAVRPQRFLFVAAAICGASAVPGWLVVRELGLQTGSGRIASADWHGYEMLFGYALAVVAGFLIGRVSRLVVTGLVGAWLFAQAAAVLAPFGALHAGASALFATGVAVLIVPKLFGGASKRQILQKRVFGPVVLLLCTVGAVAPFDAAARGKLLLVGLDLYVVLLVFMGGRMIAAAAAGQFYRRGERLDERVQPRLEGVLLACLLALAVCDLVSAPELVVGAAATSAAVLLLVRWLRWRLWTCLGAWNLAALGVGYLWLALGLAMRASRSLPFWVVPNDALHGLTTGALGSLTLLVMGRTRAMTSGVDPERSRVLLLAALLVDAAAVLRLLAGVRELGARPRLLVVSAVAWALAFATLTGFLAMLPKAQSRARRPESLARDGV